MNGGNVGKISKQWSGLGREMFTDADHFGINFPMDLDVKLKAVMLGACMLIVSSNKLSKMKTNSINNYVLYFKRISCTSRAKEEINLIQFMLHRNVPSL